MNTESVAAPEIEIDVVFLNRDAGGRQGPPQMLSTGSYRPHLRVCGTGELLGVKFTDGPKQVDAGRQYRAKVLPVYDGVDYSPLKNGTLCTVVEGPKIVAFCCVVRGATDTNSTVRVPKVS